MFGEFICRDNKSFYYYCRCYLIHHCEAEDRGNLFIFLISILFKDFPIGKFIDNYIDEQISFLSVFYQKIYSKSWYDFVRSDRISPEF